MNEIYNLLKKLGVPYQTTYENGIRIITVKNIRIKIENKFMVINTDDHLYSFPITAGALNYLENLIKYES